MLVGANILAQSAELTTRGAMLVCHNIWHIRYNILDHGGSHVYQLPRERECKLSIGVPGGGVFLLLCVNAK